MSNIDFNFILEQEGFETKGYVPDAQNSKSGVTIASGFDLGARALKDLDGLPQDIIDLLTPFLGFKGAEAEEMASNLQVSEDQAKTINQFAKSEAILNLKNKWENSTNTSFDDLSTEQATVLASVAFQYGDLEKRTPNFWNQATSGDWVGAYKNLLNFGDRYKSRRLNEAQLLWSSDSLKKSISEGTSTGILSEEAQDALNQVTESFAVTSDDVNRAVNTAVDTVQQVTKPFLETDDLSQDDNLLGENFDDLKDPKWASEQAFRNKEEEYILANADEIKKRIEKQNKKIEETNYLVGHENPQFLEPLGSIPQPLSEQEQFNLDKKNKEINDAIAANTSYSQIGSAAIDQEWMSSWMLKTGNGEELTPNYNFEINDIVPDKETWDELKKGVNEEFLDAFNITDSLPVLRRTKARILDVQEKTAIINAKGMVTGVTARLLAAILEPSAWTLAIATDGVMAPAIIMNKASRLTRIVRGGLAAGSTNAAIEMTLASQNPTLGIREVLIAAGAGFVLGGTLRGLRATNRIDDDEAAMIKAVDDFVKVKEGQEVVESGLQFTTKGKKRYQQLNKTEQDNFDKIANEYDLTLVERTTLRADGNIEIRMPDGKDEYIITKDGKLYKCK
ncbi:putative pesticin domain protein [Pelagibacter phage Hroenn EXVC015P]|nr:putative pesticin domain protein [Pelagibacter phage Bylgja EXVC010P]QLF88307.1 putative pesticin domain protein [Pelagibacter phage Himinglaeva EXVC011P]QLF88348.1 putative pesticin domain protein [Pelagibacter phage Hroenn EXVC015P]QLF88605.1 putative pesticin domain protein [Pelagibacter phage Unn EXVC019P]